MNQEILKWLNVILKDRVSSDLGLNIQKSAYQIRIEGSEKLIIINIEESYYSHSALLHCHQIDVSGLSFSKTKTKIKLISLTNKVMDGTNFIKLEPSLIKLNIDIFGIIYWMLNRIEEVNSTRLDQYSRFPSSSSHAFKFNHLNRPIVDEWIAFLRDTVRYLWPSIKLTKKEFKLSLSHDVDQPSRVGFMPIKMLVRATAGDLIKRKDFKNIFLNPYIWLKTSHSLSSLDPYNTFDWIMDQSEKNNIKSTFYFICGRTDKSKDGHYEVENKAIRKLIKNIYQRGHRIGLHPSFNCYNDPNQIKAELSRLQKVCEQEGVVQKKWPSRMHYLRWRHPETLVHLNNAGISEDSTLGYVDHVGFRCGTSHEYQGFDPINFKILDIKVKPLIAMECSLIDSMYMGYGLTDTAKNYLLLLLEQCRLYNGEFTMLWHNSKFNKDEKFFYEKLIT